MIFGKKKEVVKTVAAEPPMDYTGEELKIPQQVTPVQQRNVSSPTIDNARSRVVEQVQEDEEEQKVVQVPVYLSERDIYNLVIENNLMLKELLSIAKGE